MSSFDAMRVQMLGELPLFHRDVQLHSNTKPECETAVDCELQVPHRADHSPKHEYRTSKFSSAIHDDTLFG
jgi:hypothetical protein